MNKQPYYKVHLENGNRNITEYVESVRYEDSSEEDSLVTLSMYDSVALELADDDDFVSGMVIKLQYGFLGEIPSKVHRARITDIKHKYAGKVTMTVQCLDIGTTIKKASSNKIWSNKTSTQIVEEIASKYGLSTEIDKTSKVWEELPQGNKSDLDFIKYLAVREESGNYVVFVRNNTLYFVKRALDKPSEVTFEYGFGEGKLISFEPTLKESSAKSESSKAKVTSIDSESGEVTEAEVNVESEDSTGTTGQYKIQYGGEKGDQVGKEFVSKPLATTTDSPEEAKAVANSAKKAATLKTMVAKLGIEGEPLLEPNSVVTIKNVARRHLGNWYVNKVTHSVSRSSYSTTVDLDRNGTNSKEVSKEKAEDANETVGDKEVTEKIKVRTFKGEDGTEV